jgi:hypothetical protein
LRKAGEGLVAGINLCTGEGDGWTGLANISTRGLEIEDDKLLAGGDLEMPGLVDGVHREGVEAEGVAHGGEVIDEGDAEGFSTFETNEDEAGLDSLRNTGLSLLKGGDVPAVELLVLVWFDGLSVVETCIGNFGSNFPTPALEMSVWLPLGAGDTFLGGSLEARPGNATGDGLDTCCNIGFALALLRAL